MKGDFDRLGPDLGLRVVLAMGYGLISEKPFLLVTKRLYTRYPVVASAFPRPCLVRPSASKQKLKSRD